MLRYLVLVFLIGAAAAMGLGTIRSQQEAQLLRADPDLIPQDKKLLRFALQRGAGGYSSHCASCHGGSGAGDTERGVPSLNDDDWLFGSGMVSEIERVVAYGIRSDNPKAWNLARMPAFAHAMPSGSDKRIPSLSPGNIRDVIEYLLQLGGRDADGAAAARGAQIYSNVAGCYDCHSSDAKGDTAIGAPNLVDRITLYGDGSREVLFDSIANGRAGICPAWINRLAPAAMREIAVYVYSLSHPPRIKS